MRFSLLVLSPPDSGAANGHALAFARALVEAGHSLQCAFFHDSGALTALDGCEAPQAEPDLRAGWQMLAREHGAPLVACVASAARFGIGADPATARLLPGFVIGGLGELIEASTHSDRLLTFGD